MVSAKKREKREPILRKKGRRPSKNCAIIFQTTGGETKTESPIIVSCTRCSAVLNTHKKYFKKIKLIVAMSLGSQAAGTVLTPQYTHQVSQKKKTKK